MVIHGTRRRSSRPDTAPTVRPLTEADVASLRLTWRHRYTELDIVRQLRSFPGRSMWRPETGEYVLVRPWRCRSDIVQIAELRAVNSTDDLLDAAAIASAQHGAELMVMVESDERRRPEFYDRRGFVHLEDVITMELDHPVADDDAVRPVRFEPVTLGSARLEAVEEIDQRAFPWLWRNSHQEFRTYLAMPEVAVFLGTLDCTPVSYVGMTMYRDWGHLDRIAVDPELQGRGIGYRSLAFAVSNLARRGARSVGLSTQGTNQQSQRLYRRFGFVGRPHNDYRIHGRSLDALA